MTIKTDKLLQPASERTVDMKMTDYLVEPAADSELGYQDALILAMKREKAAFRLYSDCLPGNAVLVEFTIDRVPSGWLH